jgi:hypothetical protein
MSAKKKDDRLHDFSAIIRRRRFELKYNSAELFANDHGINRSVYQRWENGEDLNLTSLLKLLEILGMKGSDFFEKWEHRNENMPPVKYHLQTVAENEENYPKKKSR